MTTGSTPRCCSPPCGGRCRPAIPGRWPPWTRCTPRWAVTGTCTGTVRTSGPWGRPRAPSCCAVSPWRWPCISKAGRPKRPAGSSATGPRAARPACSPRNTTSPSGRRAATCRRRSSTPCCSSRPSGWPPRGPADRSPAGRNHPFLPAEVQMSSEHAGQVVVVTGASGGVRPGAGPALPPPRGQGAPAAPGGIGRAAALAFAARGAKVALLARGEAGLAGAVRDVEQAGGTALPIPADVADPDQVEAAAAQAEEALGPVDVWVNVAFTSVFAQFTDITPAEYKRVTEVSYLGYVYGTMAALKRMLPRDAGTIVQVGSALAYRGIPLQSAYCGAKHAIQGFNESLRCELLHNKSNVHVTMVQMPAVNTPQFDWVLSRLPKPAQPVPPIYQPEVAARGVLYAADHPRRREYWVGGSTAATLAANAVAPGLLDRYLARTGFKSQQTADPRDPQQPANLWQPADGEQGKDFGADGIFGDRSTDRSAQLWASHHHGVLGGLAAATVAGAGLLLRRTRR